MKVIKRIRVAQVQIIIRDGDVYALDMHGAREKENKRVLHV